MAISKKGSRKITVDNENYLWLIRRRVPISLVYGTGYLNVAIDHADNSGTVLVIHTDKEHPHNYGDGLKDFVSPSDIARWISEAQNLGWNPQQKGPQFFVRIVDGKMKII